MPTIEPDCAETRRLLERAQAGDAEAPEQLLARHRPFLRQLVELRLDPRLRARVGEIVQKKGSRALQTRFDRDFRTDN